MLASIALQMVRNGVFRCRWSYWCRNWVKLPSRGANITPRGAVVDNIKLFWVWGEFVCLVGSVNRVNFGVLGEAPKGLCVSVVEGSYGHFWYIPRCKVVNMIHWVVFECLVPI